MAKSNSSNSLILSLFYLYICIIQQLSIYFFRQTLQQYSLFHSLLYLNILFYSFISFKYYIFYSFFIIISRQQLTEITNDDNQILPTHAAVTTTTVNQPRATKTHRDHHRESTVNHHKPKKKTQIRHDSTTP